MGADERGAKIVTSTATPERFQLNNVAISLSSSGEGKTLTRNRPGVSTNFIRPRAPVKSAMPTVEENRGICYKMGKMGMSGHR